MMGWHASSIHHQHQQDQYLMNCTLQQPWHKLPHWHFRNIKKRKSMKLLPPLLIRIMGMMVNHINIIIITYPSMTFILRILHHINIPLLSCWGVHPLPHHQQHLLPKIRTVLIVVEVRKFMDTCDIIYLHCQQLHLQLPHQLQQQNLRLRQQQLLEWTLDDASIVHWYYSHVHPVVQNFTIVSFRRRCPLRYCSPPPLHPIPHHNNIATTSAAAAAAAAAAAETTTKTTVAMIMIPFECIYTLYFRNMRI